MKFLPEPPYRHGQPSRTGILLINLGTPDAPTAAAVRPYLKEFLGDPRVVEIPRALWWLILNGIILNIRPGKSAEKYAQIWTAEGSPLLVHTRRQAELLQEALDAQSPFNLTLSQEAEVCTQMDVKLSPPHPSLPPERGKEQGCGRLHHVIARMPYIYSPSPHGGGLGWGRAKAAEPPTTGCAGSVLVEYAMRYGNPSIASVLARLLEQGCTRILAFPLYPQYSASTTATAFDALFGILSRTRNQPEIRTVRSFHDHPAYIAALAANVGEYWAEHGRPDKLLMSFHGVPRYTLDQGDPYHCECQKTGRLLAEALGLGEADYAITFQSRFGRAAWLQPYTAATLEALGKQGAGRLDVVCPGFVGDCLETLEEIALEGKAIYLNAGGREYNYIPALNEHPQWIGALAAIVREHLAGWENRENPGDEATASRARALALGAKD